MSLERASGYIDSDEYVEATPKSLRLRKHILSATTRKRAANLNYTIYLLGRVLVAPDDQFRFQIRAVRSIKIVAYWNPPLHYKIVIFWLRAVYEKKCLTLWD